MLGVGRALLVATLMGALTPPGYGPAANFTSAAALADIPGNYLAWIRGAAPRYGLDGTVIAGIYSLESDVGRLDAPGVRAGENSVGAGGPGQFLSGTWARYRYRGAARSDPSSASLVPVADVAPAAACAGAAATGLGDLGRAIRLTSPTAYRRLPAWAMAGGRAVEPVDARIYHDVL